MSSFLHFCLNNKSTNFIFPLKLTFLSLSFIDWNGSASEHTADAHQQSATSIFSHPIQNNLQIIIVFFFLKLKFADIPFFALR